MPATYRLITLLILAALTIAGCAAAPTPTVALPTPRHQPAADCGAADRRAADAHRSGCHAHQHGTIRAAHGGAAHRTPFPSDKWHEDRNHNRRSGHHGHPGRQPGRPGFHGPAAAHLDPGGLRGTEKISDLPKRLSTEGAPSGSDPAVGDIAYYAPWGNLAIYYRDFDYSSGLVILGRLDSDVDALSAPGPLQVTIDLLE